ncbi:flp [Histomonas meleagridis]|uniref:flp n=1 Tax=Histomonas meleagridis TaxID=135588 RepID=UPI003559A166|nr:flp [Histomonas meleagridis]KAH0797218.1 flp [Histomonas meleagridis]
MQTIPYDVLATNSTIARFEGIIHRPCMFRTALCPDRCGHAKDLAKFTILKYLNYEKKGQYGDEEATEFYANINPNAEEDRQQADIINIIKDLKVGDQVRLDWEHIYVNNNGCRYPERPIRLLERQ